MTVQNYNTPFQSTNTILSSFQGLFSAVRDASPMYAPTGSTNTRYVRCRYCGFPLEAGQAAAWAMTEDEAELAGKAGRVFYLCPECSRKSISRLEDAPRISAAMDAVEGWLEEHLEPRRHVGSTLMFLESLGYRCGESAADWIELLAEWLPSLEDCATYGTVVALARQAAISACGGPVE